MDSIAAAVHAEQEILGHAEAHHGVQEAAKRYYAASQARRHGRVIRALQPDGDDSTSVGDALRRAAADLGSRRTGLASRC